MCSSRAGRVEATSLRMHLPLRLLWLQGQQRQLCPQMQLQQVRQMQLQAVSKFLGQLLHPRHWLLDWTWLQ